MAFCVPPLKGKTKMNITSDALITKGFSTDDSAPWAQTGVFTEKQPLKHLVSPVTHHTNDSKWTDGTSIIEGVAPEMMFPAPMVNASVLREICANSVPLQIWEGRVIDVDCDAGVMQVLLNAKIGKMPQHTGEIGLEWVDSQDKDLVHPGAVFYLTLFKRTKPSVENAQELRFRRRPSWSAAQLKRIDEDTGMILSKMKNPPVSE
jgi:hypothetical protein